VLVQSSKNPHREIAVTDEQEFVDWMARVRAGDDKAAEQLVRKYERHIRVAVRVRLTDPGLRRLFDSLDVCQSVLNSFFLRAAAGQFDLARPEDLIGLLVRMAQNKLAMQARYHHQQRRDLRREAGSDDAPGIIDAAPGPERRVVSRDVLHSLLDALTPEERELAQRRALGQTWEEIAAELGGTPQGHRMKLRRGIDRVGPSLGLDDDPEEEEGRHG
jgi:RNA polymerase sigma-70 factor (ECF subfamily)